MTSTEITTTWEQVGLVAVSTALMYLAVIAAVRINGLRSFSKMSSFDFATTVATGSLLASIALSGSSLANGVIALAVMFAVQAIVAVGRTSLAVDRVVDNQPVLLLAEGRMLEDNLRATRITRDDVSAKLRLAGVIDQRSVRFVVLETTGDISIATTEGPIDPTILRGVKDADLLLRAG
jgi:uncharacterized membrane protein YcaP (DUF421 family)